MSWRCLQAVGFSLALLSGCEPSPREPTATESTPPIRPSRESSPEIRHLDHAQPRLPTIRLWLGAEELVTETALKPVEVATGMMFREKMAESEAMLFVFWVPHRASFFMKNTTIPLSAAYIDPEGVIQEIVDLEPLNEEPVRAQSNRIQYVLEVNRGWFKRHGIEVGTVLHTEKGSLRETFFDFGAGE